MRTSRQSMEQTPSNGGASTFTVNLAPLLPELSAEG
jgi:hypothetical protein